MNFFRATMLSVGLLATVCIVGSASAQTIGYAEAIDRLSVACGSDIDRYCKGVNLGAGRIRNCLAKNGPKLSPACRVTQVQVFQLLEQRAAAQAAVMKICDADARRLCAGVQFGDGNILHCILTAKRAVSARCNQAVTDAGYR